MTIHNPQLTLHSPFGGRWWGLLLCCLLLTGCWGNRQQPGLLVEADSAMRWGRYEQADSLIGEYRRAMPRRERRNAGRYRQLLTLESKFLRQELGIGNMLLADSLQSYYKNNPEQRAKALAILGDIYLASSDYSTALDYFLQAKNEARKAGMVWLEGILCKEEGDIFLDQRMFDEMSEHFRQSFQLALVDKDTLRMANAALRMGKVHTYLQNIDSIIFYYTKAIELGKCLKNNQILVSAATSDLADIYLQMEEFGKAAAKMDRDTLNDVNWAYWHYQQNHTDSAIYYFQKSLHRYNYYADAEYLSILSELEERRGNQKQAITYLRQCIEAKDSSLASSQKEETIKAEAQHHLNTAKLKQEAAEREATHWKWGVAFVVIVAILTSIYVYREWRQQQRKRNMALAREQQLRQEEVRRNQQSRQQIEVNNQRIHELEQQLEQARQNSDQATMKQLELDTEQLRAENASIEATNERREHLLQQFHESPLYQRIRVNAGTPKFHLNDDEWEELAEWIDKVYDNLTARLLALTPLNITERQICYLLKLNLKPVQIATMLNITDTAVSMNRGRLYKKIFQEKGTSRQFDEFFKNF